jgi:hypothetical protein
VILNTIYSFYVMLLIIFILFGDFKVEKSTNITDTELQL